ncbi:hypothetical protein [Rubrivivax albus]|uniref:Uncharacterized protein n=1 Tax=Rubrivivax albus TaxID=2499835 RepID=A0A437JMQ6_9BURK|nr:hypothetical protein [Rubrivivax albus]RVT48112.1 hypothetical protein ENE75_23275 [Rubrivivax albus]
MPERHVLEELHVREFRIGGTWIEAQFDRTYQSAMLNSPSHLTFIAALVQMQKLTYVYACNRLGLNADVHAAEALKVWPTSLSISLRDMVVDEKALVQRIEFTEFRKLSRNKFHAKARSEVGPIAIDATAMIIVIGEA